MEAVLEDTTLKNDTKNKIEESLANAFSYPEYRAYVTDLAAQNSNSGPEKTEALANYTMLNDRRMARWDKTLKFSPETEAQLKGLQKRLLFLVITESWCGDASPSLPVMHKMAALAPDIALKIVLRDENLDLMERFLTNGTRSIPKLIVLDKDTETILGDWGPRPSVATQWVNDYKAAHGKLTPEFKQELQQWYNKDKGQTTLSDLMALLGLE